MSTTVKEIQKKQQVIREAKRAIESYKKQLKDYEKR